MSKGAVAGWGLMAVLMAVHWGQKKETMWVGQKES